MKISEILEQIDDNGHRGFYLFESFILELLRIHAESENKPIQIERGSNSTGSAFLPEGIGEVSTPLFVEIKNLRSRAALASSFLYLSSLKSDDPTGVLFISPYQSNEFQKAVGKVGPKLSGKFHYWGSSEIQNLIDKHQNQAEKIVRNLFSVRLKLAVSQTTEDWKSARENVILQVTEQFNLGRFSLLLGAGVSSSAGLPDWDTLLNSLFVSMLTNDESKGNEHNDKEHVSSIVKRLRQIDGPSALTLARYIRKGMATGSKEEQTEFFTSVTDRLYNLRDQRRSLNSPLIKAIVNLCTPTRTGARVKSVLTYNFDDLIERELSERNLTHRSIFEDIDVANPEELPIYHVHGFLPEDRSKYINLARSTLVFSEEGYHRIYGEAYHWSNLIQLNSLKETSCLMVGLSLTDPNLRRLLEISAKFVEKPKHFAFLKRLDLDSFVKEEGKHPIRAPTTVVKTFLDRHHRLNEEVMRELGVNVIWYESYDEIPAILQQINKGLSAR